MPIRMNLQQFIEKAYSIHQSKYDYSLSCYINTTTPIQIICKTHGLFLMTPKLHLQGSGCKKCAIDNARAKFSLSTRKFTENAKGVHGNKYDYSLTTYINNRTAVQIICSKHGSFFQRPSDHVGRKAGCPTCAQDIRTKKSSKSNSQFIADAHNVHSNRYDYSSTNYNGCYNNVEIICKLHGKFIQRATDHLAGNGCPRCYMSNGEWKIQQTLQERNIEYVTQMTFEDCINPSTGRRLKFDFYLSDYNTLIEYDGEHHFTPVQFNGIDRARADAAHTQTKINDAIKNEYAKEKGIHLIRIPYFEKGIERALNFHLKN